jgi:hypothetical protein
MLLVDLLVPHEMLHHLLANDCSCSTVCAGRLPINSDAGPLLGSYTCYVGAYAPISRRGLPLANGGLSCAAGCSDAPPACGRRIWSLRPGHSALTGKTVPSPMRCAAWVRYENVRSEIPLGRDRETQISGDALSSHLSKGGCRTRQPAPWPSSQRQMFATVSW